MKAQINSLVPILFTEKLKETIDFYEKNLGFQLESLDEEYGWARLISGSATLMLSKPIENIQFEQANFTGSFYFNVENVDELWEKLKDQMDVCYPLENFSYGMREFGIYDNNGYLLQFGKEITETDDK